MTANVFDAPGSFLPVPPVDPAEARAAALTVCDRAHDADDARRLMDALGITHTLTGDARP